MAEDLKRARYQLDRAVASDDPSERLSERSNSQTAGQAWKLEDRLTDDDTRAIIAAWKTGLSQSGIAKRFGISQASVHRLLQENGQLDSKQNRVRRISDRFTPEQVQEIITAYQAGMKQHEVAAQYKISTSTLKRLLRDHGARRCDA